jgi:uracil-DNA glycosylase
MAVVARDIYAWSKTPLPGVRVVIIGQDPYHGPGQAHGSSHPSSAESNLTSSPTSGLCFSVRPGCKVPPSLANIYKELSAEYPDFKAPKSGSLLSWSDSGVLLLNTSLTVRAGDAGSHSKKGWETFTDKVVELVDKYGGSDGAGEKGKGYV